MNPLDAMISLSWDRARRIYLVPARSMYSSFSALLAPLVIFLGLLVLLLVARPSLEGGVHINLLATPSPPADRVALHLYTGADSSGARSVRGENLRRRDQSGCQGRKAPRMRREMVGKWMQAERRKSVLLGAGGTAGVASEG